MTIEKQLHAIFKQLSSADQHAVLAFAEFLQTRQISTPTVVPIACILPRPPEESVIAAIKRLSKSYPMLEKTELFNEVSSLMTEHLLQGQDKKQIIDKLEAVFLRHYEDFMQRKS